MMKSEGNIGNHENTGSDDSPNKWLVIADDFTGATDAGVQFSKNNLRTAITTKKEFIDKSYREFDVLVIDTESRSDTKDIAYRKAFEAGKKMKEINASFVYKKIDSTLRGNIGAEISAILDSAEISHALLVPALPMGGRTTKNGNVYVNGLPLTETETAGDPKTPVKESYIPAIISHQTDKKVEVITHDHVTAGKDHLTEMIQKNINNKVHVILIDASDESDLDLIAAAAAEIRKKVLFAGSAGLAWHLPRYFNLNKQKTSNIIIAGTVSEVTRKQIEFVTKKMPVNLIDINTLTLFDGTRLREKERIMGEIKSLASRGGNIIIRSASSKETVDKSMAAGSEHGYNNRMVCGIIASFLGEIAVQIISKIKINALLLTGGDTAVEAVKQLNVSATIIEDEIIKGVPFGYFAEEQYRDIIIATKPGGFGKDDALFQVLNWLTNR